MYLNQQESNLKEQRHTLMKIQNKVLGLIF